MKLAEMQLGLSALLPLELQVPEISKQFDAQLTAVRTAQANLDAAREGMAKTKKDIQENDASCLEVKAQLAEAHAKRSWRARNPASYAGQRAPGVLAPLACSRPWLIPSPHAPGH